MKNISQQLFYVSCLSLFVVVSLFGQNSPNCETVSDDDFLTGRAYFNQGSVTNSFNTRNRANVTVGQPLVGNYFGQINKGTYGFWAPFLLPPAAPTVMASEGDLEDRVQIDWNPDPLSPAASSYKIYRNGSLLASVDGETFSFLDFNVIAGKFYTYEVSGVNTFGEGKKGSSLGFLNPNGVVTGQVKSFSQNPVPGAIVTLTPTLGTALSFEGDAMAFAEYHAAFPTAEFTVSAWVKLGDGNDNAAIVDFGSFLGKNWWLHTLPSAAGKGIRFGVGKAMGEVTELDYAFTEQTADAWHYVAATYNGSSLLLYIDGQLVDTQTAEIEAAESVLYLGRKAALEGFYTGKLDEFRIFNRQLAQTELQMFMNRSVSAHTDGLVGYWKFDEGVGTKGFDQSSYKTKIYFCGANWTTDRPNVVNAGVTDETGFYEIAGVNYGAGQTFTAKASKSFYFNQSLEFNAANESYAQLTDFDLADTAAITLFVKAFDFSGSQILLSKTDVGGNNLLSVGLNNGNIELSVGDESYDFGTLDMGFHHLAFVLEQPEGSNTLAVDFYKNGSPIGSTTFTNLTRDFATGVAWELGAQANGMGHSGYFSGLIDEVAFFTNFLTLPEIQEYANVGTNITHSNLVNYFNLNEGSETTLHDMGTGLSGNGMTFGATWSTSAAHEETLPHEFTPSSKLVTLNPSITSVDQVDFTDQSTIPVSGYVRFDKTVCFQKRVEILVNGSPNVPQIFTDEDGYFSADFEPGQDVVLTPKFEDHQFYPAFWELENLNAPVAGILFRNQTTRKVSGQLAGGLCRKSIIPEGSIVKVKVATLNGCYEKELTLENPNGKFLFEGVPSDSVTVAVTQHSNPVIYEYFQLLGGATLDLRMKSDTTDFIYFAPPNVELTALPLNECNEAMLDQAVSYSTTIKVFEEYDGGKCYLDTALLTINNDLAGLSQFDTLMTTGQLKHHFKAGGPNIVSPYLKTLQVTAEAHDEFATETLDAVVLGRRPRETTFASTSPEIPTLILRDPPGDASSAYLEQGQTTCQSWSYSASYGGGIGTSVNISLGADLTTSVGLGAEVELEIDATADFGFAINSSYSNLTTTEMETCITATEVFATGDLIGTEGDLFVGGAVNYIFGITDELIYDTLNCQYLLDKGLYVFPDGFGTTFIYSEKNIREVVIPNLLTINDTESAQRWQAILDLNTRLKQEAVFVENLSFDAGVTYEKSLSSETTKAVTHEWAVEFSSEFTQEYGLEINGIGLGAGINMSFTTGQSGTSGSAQTISRTVGYTLADDDIGDNFTINVKKDRTYGTPVFDLVSGRSSCPNEPNTQPRDGVQITANQTVAVNIPMNDVAVFTLALGNNSPSEEARTYTLATDQISNPDGAIIRFNGENTLTVDLDPFQSRDITMTVERGPVAFEYEDLAIVFASECDDNFSETLEFDIQFLEPCSRVDIGFPLQDWVLVPEDGNVLNITVNSYDVDDADLELIRVQYRRSQGDGAWINIQDLPKAELGEVFTIVGWDTQGLKDGLYEVRAITQCFGAQNAGISHVMKGKIERTAPEIFGVPEPADGILHAGDEISITFTEPIQCEQLINADIFDNNNVGLYNAQTGELIDAVVTCNMDKIVIVPNVPYQFLENYTLRVEIDNIKDLANNVFTHADWEFFVDRNPLNWLGGDIEESKIEGTEVIVTRELENRSGTIQNFEMQNVPDWVEVSPLSGSIVSGASEIITFRFKADMVNGDYHQTIVMNGALGDEPLDIDMRVVCPSPDWDFDPSQYIYTMNFTLQLDIEGEMSEDRLDQVAAFVDGELRGVTNVQFEPSISFNGNGTYFAFLTVYSNQLDGETLDFQIWDVSGCVLYGEVMEEFTFFADEFIGTPLEPQVIHTNNLVLSKIPIHAGWNWISYNLEMPDTEINAMLASLDHPQNGLIKGQTAFSQYFNGTNSWVGSLQNLSHETMYQYRSDAKDTLTLVGAPIDPSTVDIPVVAGWNWIGYLPQRGQPLGTALGSLTPLNGDIIKSQVAFAQYVAGIGWIGNLNFMSSPHGYLLKISNAGTLTYPDNFTGTPPLVANRGGSVSNIWEVFPQAYEHTMNMIAIIQGDENNLLEEDDEIGVFVGDEVRGSAKAMYIEELDAFMVFLTVYANEEGEELSFKFADASHDAIYDINESQFFAANDIVGSVDAPYPLTLATVSSTIELAEKASFTIYPNPAKEQVYLSFTTAKAERIVVRVTDALGREVERLETNTQAGRNILEWMPKDLTEGMYFISLDKEAGTETRKVRLK